MTRTKVLDGSILSFLPQDLSEAFKMFDINATRLPQLIGTFMLFPYVGDDVNPTLVATGEPNIRLGVHPMMYNCTYVLQVCIN